MAHMQLPRLIIPCYKVQLRVFLAQIVLQYCTCADNIIHARPTVPSKIQREPVLYTYIAVLIARKDIWNFVSFVQTQHSVHETHFVFETATMHETLRGHCLGIAHITRSCL